MDFRSAKEAIHYYYAMGYLAPEDDYTRLQVRVQQTAKGGNGAMWVSLEMGDMIRPLNKLPMLPKAWAMYAYASCNDFQNYTRLELVRLVAHLITKCREDHRIKNPNPDMCRKLTRLAKFALEDYAHREITGKAKFTPAQFSDAVGVHRSHWARTWEPKLKSMHNAIDPLAKQSLGAVYKRMTEIREENQKNIPATA